MIIFGIIVLIKNTLLVEIKNKNLNKTVGRFDLGFIGGQRWIRTTEVWDVRFTVWSIWPLWNLSVWCLEVESNHRQRDFQSLALPTELSRRWFFGLSAEKRVKKWRPKRGSNSWPPAWQAGALTKLSYWAVLFKYIKLLVGLHGFEPRTNRLWADSSDHWAKGPSAAFKTYGLSHKCLYMINYFSGKVKYFSIEKQKFFFGKIRPDFPKKSKIRRELSCKM